jgi:hypothetical protein
MSVLQELMPVELEVINRALARLHERVVLNDADKADAGFIAAGLFRCGFVTEEQLLTQIVETLRPSLPTRSQHGPRPGSLANPG